MLYKCLLYSYKISSIICVYNIDLVNFFILYKCYFNFTEKSFCFLKKMINKKLINKFLNKVDEKRKNDLLRPLGFATSVFAKS